jgi:hypothetical protein
MWKVVGEEGIVEEWKVGADLSALGIARRFNVCPGDFLSPVSCAKESGQHTSKSLLSR